MKADFEPWWMFEEWEEAVISRQAFQKKNEAAQYLEKLVLEFRENYKNERKKDHYFYAFWSSDEQCFCESCDEDLQIFHGIFMLYDGEPII